MASCDSRILLLVFSASLLVPPIVGAQTWLPLETGFFWAYSGSFAAERLTVAGAVEIRGTSTQAILYSPSTSNEGLRNFWTNAPGGDVFLHGFENPPGEGRAYDPPILFVDPPLSLGKTWEQTTDVYDLITDEYLFSLTITLGVLEAGEIAVPAGTFDAFGIGIVPGAFGGGEAALGLDGERAIAGGPPKRYYAESVGVVRNEADDTYDLLAYGFPIAVESSSWAEVKNLYR